MLKKCLLLCLVLLPSIAFANDQHDALAFVQKTGLGNNFETVTMGIAARTATFKKLSAAIGDKAAFTRLKASVHKATTAHQGEWNQDLADAYLHYFSGKELRSLMTQKAKSPYIQKLKDLQSEVSKDMEGRSNDLLQNTVIESIKGAMVDNP
ncbi:hypothetical protein [Gallaecimonas mangrovi]|uniref:hypothetical protein n=1 Tax=Gallaecimonas mangrovi TaxID=2291597 RepID=UPI000E2079E4|nr:hypothetical protein [Gallaecimonas mangrovi]